LSHQTIEIAMNHYRAANEAKASFEEVYSSPTPHAYLREMDRLNYEIGEQANPYFEATARLMLEQLGPDASVKLLDLGCSYGVGAALLNHSISFSELARFFAEHKSRDYHDCIEATRDLLEATESPDAVSCLGLDCSEKALRFAEDTGLLDGTIARNLEEDQSLPPDEVRMIQECNLLTSTGAIGYVGNKTLSVLLRHLGKSKRQSHGPYSVVTILRMFDSAPIAATFERFGFHFAAVPGVRLRQRQFETEEEQARTLKLLVKRGIDTDGWESEGFLYADLFAAAPAGDMDSLVNCLRETHSGCSEKTLAGNPE
jgi:hypothetical protein